MIEKESDITAVSVRELRKSLDLSQREFWARVCITNTAGCAYETGKTQLPKVVVRALFLHYIVGIPSDPSKLADMKAAVDSAVATSTSKQTAHAKEVIAQSIQALSGGLKALEP